MTPRSRSKLGLTLLALLPALPLVLTTSSAYAGPSIPLPTVGVHIGGAPAPAVPVDLATATGFVIRAVSEPDVPGIGMLNPPAELASTTITPVTRDSAASADPTAVGSAPDAGTTGGGCTPTPSGNIDYQYKPKNTYFREPGDPGRGVVTPGLSGAYTMVGYQRNHAHQRPDGEWTYQVVLCAFGGSKARNTPKEPYRLLREGISISFVDDLEPNEGQGIGTTWDTHSDDGQSSASINFQVAAGPASVGTAIPTSSGGKNTGSRYVSPPQGENGASLASKQNLVNGYWEHQDPWWYLDDGGSADFQGSVAEGLYELAESHSTFKYRLSAFVEYHCRSAAPGVPCEHAPSPFEPYSWLPLP